MPDNSKFRGLSNREKALVSIAVLLDGDDSVELLRSDKERALALSRAAKDLVDLAPELRMPLVGTLLRDAISELVQEQGKSVRKA